MRRREGGQSLVEFALVAPIFFPLVFAVLQMGLLLGGQNGVVNAVRETARYASTYRVATASDAQNVCNSSPNPVLQHLTNVLKRSIPGYDPSLVGTPTVKYTWHQNPDGISYFVQVEVGVSYRYPLYVPLVSNIIDAMDGSVDQHSRLSAHEEMRIENDALGNAGSDVTC